jgi:hypothetical protein
MPSNRQQRRKLVAAGVILPAMAIGSLVTAEAATTPQATSTKIYACYSDKTGLLSHLNYPKVATCPIGSKLISWNVAGPQGANGPQGSQGAIGPQGAKGVKGGTGATGAQGVAGPQGVQGATGAKGSTGARGAMGPQGVAGGTGKTGPPGRQGTQGAQGTTGAQGPVGPSAYFQESVATPSSQTDTLRKGLHVLATWTPATTSNSSLSGDYAVAATVNGNASPGTKVTCWVKDVSALGGPGHTVAFGSFWPDDAPRTDELIGVGAVSRREFTSSAGSYVAWGRLELECSATQESPRSFSLRSAKLTETKVGSATVNGKPLASTARNRLRNHFVARAATKPKLHWSS